MKNILLAALLLPGIAFAGLSITEGNVKQESCGFPEAISAHFWNIARPAPMDVLIKNKLMTVGKVISPGDALFYANIASNNKRVFYVADANVEVIGTGMTPDIAIPNGSRLYAQGMIKGKGLGNGYLLVGKEDSLPLRNYVAIKDDGFLCSVKVSIDTRDGSLLVQNATAYQKTPLLKREEAIQHFDETIALTLNRLDETSAYIGINLLKNGQVVKQKEIQLDTMSGRFDIAGMQILFERVGKSSIKIISILEPNYLVWDHLIQDNLNP